MTDTESVTPAAIEAAARALAQLEDGEEWPTNTALGGNLTGTRDDEYRAAKFDEAREALEAAAPHMVATDRDRDPDRARFMGCAHRGELANRLLDIYKAAERLDTPPTDPWTEVAHAVWDAVRADTSEPPSR